MAWPLTLLSIFLVSLSTSIAKDLVLSSCVHANYPDLCIKTLESYSNSVNTPRDLAKASVRVSVSQANLASNFIKQLKPQNKREEAALKDCVEEIRDSVDNLSKTLSELQHLSGESFGWHMNNAETWVTAALTYEDTCLDGFKEINGKVRSDVKNMITIVARVTSNALYLINLLKDK